MNASLEEILQREMSRRNCDTVVSLIYQKEEVFEKVMDIFLSNREPVSRRAAWVADIYSEDNPGILKPYVGRIITSLPDFGHEGLKRHSLRMLSRCSLPDEDLLGRLMSICFDWLASGNVAVASKVTCMDILFTISETVPEIKNELGDTIEWRMAEETPGFQTHGRKILALLNR